MKASGHPGSHHYKWVVLSNTTLGMLLATINASIVLISMPAIFRGIHVNPLLSGNASYLLWMLMGYLLVSAVFVVTFGRLGDIFGRVRMYNAGFAVFTVASILLSLDPFTGGRGALWLIVIRVVQGIGGAMIMANSTAILTDAFPVTQRGLALGVSMVAGIAGSFLGLVIGGVLSEVAWRLVFWASVPVGVLGTVWGYRSLREVAERRPAKLDWWGNLTFGLGLTIVLAAIVYGIEPYGGHPMGWTNPWVLAGLFGGVALLVAFAVIESRVQDPMFHLELFRIRAFSAGNAAQWLNAVARGGLQFMLIIWLQGIWLPLHGYDYVETPLWAGIYLLPLTAGFLVAGPVSGWLSDRFGARAFATGGMVVVAASFGGLLLLPTNFSYVAFAALIGLSGLGSGLFASPNAAAVMNAVPASQRGAASGMRATFQNSGMVLSIGLFFSLMIVGLSTTLPHSLYDGLTANGVSPAEAHRISGLPPVGVLFASFLGYNPIGNLLGPQGLHDVTQQQAATLTGKDFFPQLIAGPFHHGLVVVFTVAIVMSLIGAVASLSRGGKYVHIDDHVGEVATDESTVGAAPSLSARSTT